MAQFESARKFSLIERCLSSGIRPKANRNRRDRKRLRFEQLEGRRVLAALLLDFPGIDGDAKATGASTTDIALTSFKWGFQRDNSTPLAKLTDPISVQDIVFEKPSDSASNELFEQANFSPVNSKIAKLRLVSDSGTTVGQNLLSFDLTSPRITAFDTQEGGQESGAISFSKIDLTESLTATKRTASWNLLTGSATSSAIIGPGNIDVGTDVNLETVLQIGGQKLTVNGFEWEATNRNRGNAQVGTFKITRGIDVGTAGLLGSAANGTVFDKLTITDRKEVSGQNRVVMEWNLYNAFISDFDLSIESQGEASNSLSWSYSKIEVTAKQFAGEGVPPAKDLTFGLSGLDVNEIKVDSQANSFGVIEPSITTDENVSFLKFDRVGAITYSNLEWSLTKPVTLGATSNTLGRTEIEPLKVNLPAGPSTPGLLTLLATQRVIKSVEHLQSDKVNVLSSLDMWKILNSDKEAVSVSEFAIESDGLQDPQVTFALTVPKVEETFTDRSNPLETSGNFNSETQSSTGALNFGGRTVNSDFELVITEAGQTSEIPVLSAGWGVSRDASRDSSGVLSITTPQADAFNIQLPRGVHSPGLWMAGARGTELDAVSLVRYHSVQGVKTELYRWDMTKAYITSYENQMLPGTNNSQEFDRISLTPSTVILKTDRVDASGKDIGDVATGWNFKTNKAITVAGLTAGEFGDVPDGAGNTRVLQVDLPGKNNNLPVAAFELNATLPVGSTSNKGERPTGDPDLHDLVISLSGRPNVRMFNEALAGKALGSSTEIPTLRLPPNLQGTSPSYAMELPGTVITGYTYQDSLDSTGANTAVSFDASTKINSSFTPAPGAGNATKTSWNLLNDTTTSSGGFGTLIFPANSEPQYALEINDGTNRSQVSVAKYSFGVENDVTQLVGKAGAPVPLAPRGTADPDVFRVSIPIDTVLPGFMNAIARKLVIPEMTIIERDAPRAGFPTGRPVREWTLTDVLVESLSGDTPAEASPSSIDLVLNPASAKSKFIFYDLNGTPTNLEQKIDFVTPPSAAPIGLVTGASTGAPRGISLPPRFTDQEVTTTLRYSATILSGANVFDSVTVDSINRLVLDYKAGQRGMAQVRVDALDSFGLVGSLTINVAVDVDGIIRAPAGSNVTVSTNEDTPYTITATDFGFTDPNDFPANNFVAVKIAGLPPKGTLTLNNAAVTVNQTLSITDINAGRLRYTPAANENGAAYTSFLFQVQDDGSTANGGENLDPTANRLTFNVVAVNDSPVFTSSTINLSLPTIVEDTSNPAGMLLSAIAPLISDADAGALNGIAVVNADNSGGEWQYALDGVTWQNFGTVSNNAARLLAIDTTTRVRFVPNADVNSAVGTNLGFRAWDQTTGTVGGVADTLPGGGSSAFSSSTVVGTLRQLITPVNDSPVLTQNPVLLSPIEEDAVDPLGTLVSDFVAGMVDADANALKGIAVQSAEDANGVWEYTLNNGVTWTPFGPINSSTSRLLPADTNTRIRFTSIPNFAGEAILAFKGWDRTSGVAGSTVNLSSPASSGGTTAYSGDSAIALLQVLAVNDGPTLTSPSSLTAITNTPLVFSTINGNAISVDDIDAGNAPIQMTISVEFGKIALGTLGGLTVDAGGNNSPSISVVGSIAAINAALQGSAFTPNRNFFDALGSASLRVTISDLGNTGPTAETVDRTIPISVQVLPVAINLGTLDSNNPSGTEDGSLSSGDIDIEYYSFTIPNSSNVRIVLSGMTTAATSFDLVDSNNQVIGSGGRGDAAPIDFERFPLAAGTYIIAVRGTGVATPFNLSITTTPLSDDLILNANVLGTLNATTLPTIRVVDSVSGGVDRQDYYKFTTTVASPLRVILSGLSEDFDIQLLNANGVVLNSSVLGLNSIESIARSSIPAGDYYLRIFELPNRNFTSYDLSITLAVNSDDSITRATVLGTLDTTTTPVLRSSGSVGGTADIQDYFEFTLASQSDVRVNLSGLSADIDLSVLDQFGRLVNASAFSSNTTENVLLSDLAAGTYFVRMNPFASSVSDYELAIAIDSTSDDLITNAVVLPALSTTTPTVQVAGSVNATLDRADYYRFTLSTTSNVRVNLSGMSGDANVFLEDSFGRFIAAGAQATNAIDSLLVTSLAAGDYHIRVRAVAPSTNYVLTTSINDASDDLISNAVAIGTLNSSSLPTIRRLGTAGGADLQDYYRFDLATAGFLRLNLSNMTSDLDVEVLDAFGQVIVFGAQTGTTIERVTTPSLAVGTYYLRVFHVASTSSSYDLAISTDFNGDDLVRGGFNMGTLATSPLTRSGTVGGATDIQDYVRFTLTSTRNVRFQLSGLTADLDFELLDSFGRTIGTGTNSGTTSEDITVSLVSGVYYLRILSFIPANVSNYSLTITGV